MVIASGKLKSLSVLLAGLVTAMPCRAEEAGLPQLDTAMFPEQLFWLALSFAFLYLLLSRVAMPRIEQTQGNRRAVIAAELNKARSANEAAKATSAQVEKALADARAKAQASIKQMLAQVAEESAARQAEQERHLTHRLRKAEENLAMIREAALLSIQSNVPDLAAAMVEKILGHKMRGE